VSEIEKGALRIKLHDKRGALELAAKIQGFYVHEDVKQATQINIVISPRERSSKTLAAFRPPLLS
jgi:hypothetical protein